MPIKKKMCLDLKKIKKLKRRKSIIGEHKNKRFKDLGLVEFLNLAKYA